jgi:hypothetical protein
MRPSLIRSTLVAVGLTVSMASVASAQNNPFNINGVVPDSPLGGPAIPDPHGNSKELGPVNGADTKIGVINTAPPPMLEFTNPNGQVDLGTVWLATHKDLLNSDQWLYFAWNRPDSNTGSGFISLEFQQNALSPSCVYTGVDFTNKNDPQTIALIAGCNPWRNRKSGDFIILWDQQGNTLDAFADIKRRTFTQVDPSCVVNATTTCEVTLGGIEDLGSVAAAISADRFSGEMAINLTQDVFSGDGCLTFANVLPGTVTGNSDSADYKDTVFSTFPPITNCGILTVKKLVVDANLNPYVDPLNPGFGYTVLRGGSLVRNNTDAANHPIDGLAPQTSIVRPNATGGTAIHANETQTHTDLIPGTYTLTETAPLPGSYVLVSIICTDGTGAHTITGGGTFAVEVPDGVAQTDCVITNKFPPTTPTVATGQSVKLNDSVTITGIQPGANSPATAVTFQLFSEGTCTTQVGANIPATLTYNVAGTEATANTFATNGVSVTVTLGVAKTFYWRVIYPGDGQLNNAVTTACGDETTVVNINK